MRGAAPSCRVAPGPVADGAASPLSRRESDMTQFDDTIRIRRWHVRAMMFLSGFAIGDILAKTASTLGL